MDTHKLITIMVINGTYLRSNIIREDLNSINLIFPIDKYIK